MIIRSGTWTIETDDQNYSRREEFESYRAELKAAQKRVIDIKTKSITDLRQADRMFAVCGEARLGGSPLAAKAAMMGGYDAAEKMSAAARNNTAAEEAAAALDRVLNRPCPW